MLTNLILMYKCVFNINNILNITKYHNIFLLINLFNFYQKFYFFFEQRYTLYLNFVFLILKFIFIIFNI